MDTTRLIGGRIATPHGTLERLDVVIRAGRIADLLPPDAGAPASAESIDVSGSIVAPGLIDLQINGGWGHDFTGDPTKIGDVAARLPSTGVTAFVPTIVTTTKRRRLAAIDALTTHTFTSGAAAVLGLHFEGPVISPDRPGVHDPDLIGVPAADELDTWSRERGVTIVTLAPEVPGALELTETLSNRGVVVSAGHTNCTSAQFDAARAAGLTMVTHLFNAMSPFSHRSPGPIGSALADGDVHVGLICDGIHVDPIAVRMAWRALGAARTMLVTDAVAALGLDVDTVGLGDRTVTVSDRGVRTHDDVLAGSNLSLDQAVRNLVEFAGCAPADAIRAASTNPADLLGLADRGRIQVGAIADLVVFDQQLRVERTIIAGLTAWKL